MLSCPNSKFRLKYKINLQCYFHPLILKNKLSEISLIKWGANSIIVGVHIRISDYKTLNDGLYK